MESEYSFNDVLDNSFDVVIVGGGGSGLACALFTAEKLPNAKIAVLCKTYAMGSHTTSAKGGINAALGNIKNDSTDFHVYDTLKSGKGLCDEIPTRKMCESAPSVVMYLEKIGVEFDKTSDGKIDQRTYGGQTVNFGSELANRACFVKDHTGHDIMKKLHTQISLTRNISIFNYHQVIDCQFSKDCSNVIAYDISSGDIIVFRAKSVVFATGGFSQIYATNSSSSLCTGCGHRILLQNGFKFKDIELVQFHPTGLKGLGMLISEACRSEGGYLRNSSGERFMKKYHAMKELAPRDVIARAIFSEAKSGDVFLDLTHIDESIVMDKLTSSYTVAKYFAGIDISKELLPIYPTAHYNMGGMNVDENYSLGFNNVYAIGELACASVHGANRLGCNSLLELFTSARIVSESIMQNLTVDDNTGKIPDEVQEKIAKFSKNSSLSLSDILHIRERICAIMDESGSIIKNGQSMQKALSEIDGIYNSIIGLSNFSGVPFDEDFIALFEVQSMAVMAKSVLTCAIARRYSIGSHHRDDFTFTVENPQHSVMDRYFMVSSVGV